MHYFKNPESDTYICNNPSELYTNYGSNQTLAVDNSFVHNTVKTDTKSIRRSLIKFNLTDVNRIVPTSSLSESKFILKLKTADQFNVPVRYVIYAYPLSSSWEQGKGMFAYADDTISDGLKNNVSSIPYTDLTYSCVTNYLIYSQSVLLGNSNGVNWVYTNYPNTSSIWYTPMYINFIPSDDYLTVPSTSSFIRGGGTWYYQSPSDYSSSVFQIESGSSLMCSQSFEYQKADIEMDITKLCMCWIHGVIPNNGLILMSSTEVDYESSDNGELQFFSNDTNTIYAPTVDIQWRDASFSTGSLSPLTSSAGAFVTINSLRQEYVCGSIIRFNVFARDLFPSKTFDRLQNVYLNTKHLPSSSYYSIIDNDTEETIVPFDDYSLISCGDGLNYFTINTKCMLTDRLYKVLIKVVFDDGSTTVFDNNSIFKLIK